MEWGQLWLSSLRPSLGTLDSHCFRFYSVCSNTFAHWLLSIYHLKNSFWSSKAKLIIHIVTYKGKWKFWQWIQMYKNEQVSLYWISLGNLTLSQHSNKHIYDVTTVMPIKKYTIYQTCIFWEKNSVILPHYYYFF